MARTAFCCRSDFASFECRAKSSPGEIDIRTQVGSAQNHHRVKLTFGQKMQYFCEIYLFSTVELFENPAHQLKTLIPHKGFISKDSKDSFHSELLLLKINKQPALHIMKICQKNEYNMLVEI